MRPSELLRELHELTEQQRAEAMTACDQILVRCARIQKDLSEAIAGLKEAFEDAITKLENKQ